MIRFMLGLILVIGAAGGLEQDTATISETLMLAAVGFGLMLWGMEKVTSNGLDD